MALEISTVGAAVKYAIETTKGTRPTTGYTTIPDVNTAPEIAIDASTIDASNITDTITRYIAGRRDPGGVQNMTLNHTSAVKTAWATMVAAADNTTTGIPAGFGFWFEYAFPNGESVFFPAHPLAISTIPGIEQNSLSTLQGPFLVEGEAEFATSST